MRSLSFLTGRRLVLVASLALGILGFFVLALPLCQELLTTANEHSKRAGALSSLSEDATAPELAAASLQTSLQIAPPSQGSLDLMSTVVDASKLFVVDMQEGQLDEGSYQINTPLGPVGLDTASVTVTLEGAPDQVSAYILQVVSAAPLRTVTQMSLSPQDQVTAGTVTFTNYSLTSLPFEAGS